MVNKIILSAEGDLEDKVLREWVSKLSSQIENINKRTKRQTLQIQELQKKLRENEKKEKTKEQTLKKI